MLKSLLTSLKTAFVDGIVVEAAGSVIYSCSIYSGDIDFGIALNNKMTTRAAVELVKDMLIQKYSDGKNIKLFGILIIDEKETVINKKLFEYLFSVVLFAPILELSVSTKQLTTTLSSTFRLRVMPESARGLFALAKFRNFVCSLSV